MTPILYTGKACSIQKIVFLSLIIIPLQIIGQTGPGGISDGGTLKLWLDKTSINADGSNPATGSIVSSWFDKSGNNIVVSENIPSVATYGLNGVIFNGNGYLAGSDAGFPTGNANRTLIVCLSSPSTNTDDALFSYGVANTNQSYGLIKLGIDPATRDGVRNFFYANDLDVANGLLPSNTLKIITSTYTNNVQSVYLNNGAATTRTPTTPTTILGGNQSLQVGGWTAFNLRSQATIAEVIFYNGLLDAADIIIINNYLAAKYGLTLTANDLYDEDNLVNGNYDFDVAGIGRAASVAQQNADAQGSIVRINSPSSLGNNEYYIWGHDGSALTPVTTNIPATVQARLSRIWRGSKTGNVGGVSVTFDLTGLGSVVASDLRLLVDVNNDASFTDETIASGGVIGGATSAGGNLYRFTNVNALNNNIRFSLGTANSLTTPLPIELISFYATAEEDKVQFKWETASEMNNDYFEVQRIQDNGEWQVLSRIPGAGDSREIIHYQAVDSMPLNGRSYYRLRQIDYDKKSSYSPVRIVDFFYKQVVYPNPTAGTVSINSHVPIEKKYVTVFNSTGLNVSDRLIIRQLSPNKIQVDLNNLPTGIYLICTQSSSTKISKL